jgi:GntR family transcriptional regulator, rspAB operon transcriptional repressor
MQKLSIKKSIPIRKRVYNHLRDQILNGLILPNKQLSEAQIAKDIGVSRTPVREALHSLELERLVTSRPSVGYVVRPLGEEEVQQICEIRKAIEKLAAQWAMEKAAGKLARDLKKNIVAAEAEVASGNVKAFVELDAQFHEIIAKLSGSEQLIEMSQFLRRQMLRYRIQSIYLAENVLRAIAGHRKLLDAVEAGSLEELEKAICSHLEQAKEDVLHYAFETRKEGQEGL